MPLLSLTMIVKNEAAMLPAFFNSTRGIFDEIIVVDTGSTDSSVVISESVGARVIHYEWTNDFAAARNVALQNATGRWVAYFDADERLSLDCCRQIRRLVEDEHFASFGAATVHMRNYLPNNQLHEVHLLRVFRNDPSITFKHRIHENVTESLDRYLLNNALNILSLDGVVEHFGYLSDVATTQNKQARDQKMLEHLLDEDPDDLYAHFKLLELARYWDDTALLQRAANRVWNDLLSGGGNERFSDFHYAHELAVLLSLGCHPEAPSKAIGMIQTLTADLEASANSQFQIGKLYEEQEQYIEAESIYKKCLRLPTGREPAFANIRPLMGLCRLALVSQDFLRAQRCVLTACRYSIDDPEVVYVARHLINMALERKEGAMALELLGPFEAIDEVSVEDVLLSAKAAVLIGDVGRAIETLKKCIDHPLVKLGYLLCLLCSGTDKHVDVDIERTHADIEMLSWLKVILYSHNGLLIQNFLTKRRVLENAFPWVEDAINDEMSTSNFI